MSSSFMDFPHVMELGSNEAVENALTGTIKVFFYYDHLLVSVQVI